jgi:hypothetical protein
MQSRDGITWTLGLNEDLSRMITIYTEQLLGEGTVYLFSKQINFGMNSLTNRKHFPVFT